MHRRAREGDCVTPIAADDRIDRIEDGDMDDRHRAARPARSQLLTEDTVLVRGDRRVIESARIDRDLVPVAQASMAPGPRRQGARPALRGPELRSERVAYAVGKIRCARRMASADANIASTTAANRPSAKDHDAPQV